MTANGEPINAWQPRAVGVRIHPATRYRLHLDRPVLEARVDLTDAMGDPIKASAQYVFELSVSMNTPGNDPTTLYRWDQSVLTEADHRERYDSVTRSYVFPLTLENFDIAAHSTRLRVVATLADGRVLNASAPVVVVDPR